MVVPPKVVGLVVLLLLCFLDQDGTNGFAIKSLRQRSTELPRALQTTSLSACSSVDVILFGVGDLRVDDHLGLQAALYNAKLHERENDNENHTTKIIPLFCLSDDMLVNIPGAIAHTADTANMLAAALRDLDASLRKQIHPDWALQTLVLGHEDSGKSLMEAISRIANILDTQSSSSSSSSSSVTESKVRVHVCDLGEVDNRMRYGPYGRLLHGRNDDPTTTKVELIPWNNALRETPWMNASNLSDLYPEYETKYVTPQVPPKPVTLEPFLGMSSRSRSGRINNLGTIPGMQSTVPSAEQLLQQFMRILDLNETQCSQETNTGLYATHWGGLSAASVGEQSVSTTLRTYVAECKENDLSWSQHPLYTLRNCVMNGKSLEHGGMAWQLAGDGSSPTGNVQTNWLAGEAMIRYLAAPLLFGTISPRRVWHSATSARSSSTETPLWWNSPLRRLVEGQEWHRLLATRNIVRSENSILSSSSLTTTTASSVSSTVYKYWRYHGFLCRYAETNFAIPSALESYESNDEKQGILLIHGFGASGMQWNKAMGELKQMTTSASQGLAPDLIGFGHSEKPAISYTGYMWDSQCMDFVKEIAVHRNKWSTFVTGGNSIGGFTSMSLAACDSASGMQVSSSGAPGTGRCKGLVLMNSAGPVKTRDEVEAEIASGPIGPLSTVAQATAAQALPLCKPPPRLVARAFGNVLLGYLRPRIQSICRNLYPTNPDAVDAALCLEIKRDSLDPGAINVMMAGAKLPPPRTANELLGANFGAHTRDQDDAALESCFVGPVLIAQGVLDPLNNSTDRMLRFHALREGIDMAPIQAGHCPHDELPDQIARSITTWMAARVPVSTTVSYKL